MPIPAQRNRPNFFRGVGTNLGLYISKLIPEVDERGEIENKETALNNMATFKLENNNFEAYRNSFAQWKDAIGTRKDCDAFDIVAETRVLLGTGNASVFEFGFNLNFPWGVPYIAGSTLKGAVSSYLARYGDQDWARSKSSKKSEAQVELFGGTSEKNGKDYVGSLIFHDAWLCPWQSRGRRGDWFDADIITPHFSTYYQGSRLPDGTDDPIPIKIAALCPGLKFHVVIQGPEEYRKLAKDVLLRLLKDEGIGGKTAVGYGRFAYVKTPEENLADAKKEISEITTSEALQDAFKKFKNERMLQQDLRGTLYKVGYSEEIESVWQSLHPLGLLEQKMRDGVFDKLNQLNNQYRNLRTGIGDWLESESLNKASQSKVGQSLFELMFKKWGDEISKNQDMVIVKDLSFDWSDTNYSVDELFDIIESPKTMWPPRKNLRAYIEKNERFSEEENELLSMALDEAGL